MFREITGLILIGALMFPAVSWGQSDLSAERLENMRRPPTRGGRLRESRRNDRFPSAEEENAKAFDMRPQPLKVPPADRRLPVVQSQQLVRLSQHASYNSGRYGSLFLIDLDFNRNASKTNDATLATTSASPSQLKAASPAAASPELLPVRTPEERQNYKFETFELSEKQPFAQIVSDRFGRVIGELTEAVIPDNSTFVLPARDDQTGSYFVVDNLRYYVPGTGVSGTGESGETSTEEAVTLLPGRLEYVRDLGARLESFANELCLELHHNFQHNQNYRAVYAEAYQILVISRFLAAVHPEAPRGEIVNRVHELRKELSKVERQTEHWTRVKSQQVGILGLSSILDLIDTSLHYLEFDVTLASDSLEL